MQIALNAIHESRNALGIGNFEASGLWRNHLFNGCYSCPWAGITEGIAPAGEAGVRRKLDDDHIERGNCRGALFETRNACVERNTDVVCLDVCDQHAPASFAAIAAAIGEFVQGSLLHYRPV